MPKPIPKVELRRVCFENISILVSEIKKQVTLPKLTKPGSQFQLHKKGGQLRIKLKTSN